MIITPTSRFSDIIDDVTMKLARAPDVNVGEWQAISDGRPQEMTIELEDYSFGLYLPDSMEELQAEVQPNLPWAEEHFQERVSGVPHNPPPSHVRWPFAQASNSEHRDEGKFSHTYPERFWPAFAGGSVSAISGIRYPYGDLGDLVALLRERPGTRQAYLPVWFPEDGYAASVHERVPCTLGYHFLIRNGKLKVTYYIRSCDFYRHFRDDVYMAGRLAQWVTNKVGLIPGRLVMHISSLHIFSAERQKIQSESSSYLMKNFGR